MTAVVFTVPGRPAPQGSKRHVGYGIMVESSPEVGPWRERVALAAHNAMLATGATLFTGAVTVDLRFVLPRPKSTPKRRTPPAVKRPDVDKLARRVGDALTGVVLLDDAQVVELRAGKRLAAIGETPGVAVTVTKNRDCERNSAMTNSELLATALLPGAGGAVKLAAITGDGYTEADVPVDELSTRQTLDFGHDADGCVTGWPKAVESG